MKSQNKVFKEKRGRKEFDMEFQDTVLIFFMDSIP